MLKRYIGGARSVVEFLLILMFWVGSYFLWKIIMDKITGIRSLHLLSYLIFMVINFLILHAFLVCSQGHFVNFEDSLMMIANEPHKLLGLAVLTGIGIAMGPIMFFLNGWYLYRCFFGA